MWTLDIDRLGRDPALSNQVLSLIEKNGAEVYISTAPHTPGQKTIGHRYISAIQSVRAAEDQALRVRRYRQGMRSRIARGLIASNLPRGYHAIRDPHTGAVTSYQFTPEIQTIQYITRQFLAGHSYSEIRRRLNTHHPLPNGRPWSYNTIRNICLNDTYAGYPSFAQHKPEQPSPLIPPLWDKDTHAAIIHERQRRSRGPYHRRGSGPLTGVIYCHRCARPMTRFYCHNRYYLRCTTHAHAKQTSKTCHPNLLRESAAIAALTQHLHTLTTPAALDAALTQLQHPADHQRLTLELQRTAAIVQDLITQRRTIALDRAARKMTADIYHHTDTTLQSQLTAAESRHAELTRALQSLPDLAQQKKALASLASAFPQLLQQAEPAEISTLLQTAGIRITCDSNHIHTITP
ncbi:MAG: hypothetical protein GWO24_30410 [Akkermansiaceae bacterium]|nr:hypothetical protein [Akkermansiaceae bacterium]